MFKRSYTYQSAFQDALKITWQVEDLIGGDKQLDFTRPFLPEALVRAKDIECLNPSEQLILNQIRGYSYLHLFMLVEKFIIPTVLKQVQRLGYDNIYALQALLCFAEEEGKHIHLFQRFAEEFRSGFGTLCVCIESTSTIVARILEYHPLSVFLLMLQFEWTTQSHYLESVRDNRAENLDPRFCNLLKHHWLEEVQHTQLDTLLAYELAQTMNPVEIQTVVADYLGMIELLDQVLMAQVGLDLQNLNTALNRTWLETEQLEIRTVQATAYRWAFLCAGMTHPNFLQVLADISPIGKARVIALAKALS